MFENVPYELDDELMTITFDHELIEFKLDDRLSALLLKYPPLVGAYHYALSCASGVEKYKVVLKRQQLIECYTLEYNPLYLMACGSNIQVKLVSDCCHFRDLLDSKTKEGETLLDNMDSKVILSHRKVSIHEAISLSDKSKRITLCSSPIEFIDARPNRKLYFKKAVNHDDANFKTCDTGEEFEIRENWITRYFKRINGENIILAEFISGRTKKNNCKI